MNTNKQDRKTAFYFYNKHANGYEEDWMDTGNNDLLEVDQDIIDLSKLLASYRIQAIESIQCQKN